jgi:multiple sugar transport system permease protein
MAMSERLRWTDQSRRHWRKRVTLVGLYALVGLFLLWTLFPIYWIFLTSLKTTQQVNTMPPLFFFKPTLETYIQLLGGDAMLAFRNSLIVSSATVLIALVVGFPAAYTLARTRFRAREQVNFYVLSMRMAPAFAFLVPYYLTFRFLHLLDSYLALIMINLTFTIPFAIWMLESVVQEMPIELEEAALVDGCTQTGVMWRIVAPLMAPSIAATAVLSFVFCWNEFFFAYVLSGTSTRTVPVMLTSLIGLMGVDWVKMSAASTIAIIPTIVLALLAQRFLVRGLTMGAVKG